MTVAGLRVMDGGSPRRMRSDCSGTAFFPFEVSFWHITIFGCIVGTGRDRGTADLVGPAVGSCQSRLTHFGSR
jgi:hypothetical protein